MKLPRPLLLLLGLAGVGTALGQASAFDPDPARGPREGSTWHFIKSNRDGSKPWSLVMHVVAPQQIEVIKSSGSTSYVEVHALVDLERALPTHLQQWNLRCGERQPTNTVLVRPMPEGGTQFELRPAGGAPRHFAAGPAAHVWGFDLGAFALIAPRLRHRAAFQLGLVDLNQPDGSGGFKQAPLRFVPVETETLGAQPALRYRLESPLFDGKQGDVWLSPDGELLKAEHELLTSRDWRDWKLERVRSEHLPRAEWERFKLDLQRRTARAQLEMPGCQGTPPVTPAIRP